MHMVKVFRIKGRFRCGEFFQEFRKEVPAIVPKHALEKVYSEIGSKHGVKRHQILIEKIEEISLEEVENPLVREILGETDEREGGAE
ncbi:50S ribosomal protein L18a [Thermococci archaeon]|nr:MAG: 50S ribosomal protein L18a [Thermococci archaeon]RLF97281.1 MAG: 50S ribosomal protein L18a [Thermococci archaeon]